MKIVLISLGQPKESWLSEASEKYSKQISGFMQFEHKALKSKGGDEKSKLRFEEEQFLGFVNSSDRVVLFDQQGKTLKDSHHFSEQLVKSLELSSQRVVFVIGGAYGFGEKIRERANEEWCLSSMTLSHHTATLCALEQIYRGLTIWKGHPYHND